MNASTFRVKLSKALASRQRLSQTLAMVEASVRRRRLFGPTLTSFSHKYWIGKTDGGHRYSTEQWFQKYASELLAMFPSRGTLLDVGCGACQLTTYLAPEFEQVYAVDFSETMLATARQRIESLGLTNVRLLSGTAQKFPEVISSANVILSYQLLQYLTLADFSQHLHECQRVLNKGGMVCAAMIPNSALKDLYYHGRLSPTKFSLLAECEDGSSLRAGPSLRSFRGTYSGMGSEIGFRKRISKGWPTKADLASNFVIRGFTNTVSTRC